MMYKNLQIWELNYTQKDDIQFKRIHREELWFVTCPLPPLPPNTHCLHLWWGTFSVNLDLLLAQ